MLPAHNPSSGHGNGTHAATPRLPESVERCLRYQLWQLHRKALDNVSKQKTAGFGGVKRKGKMAHHTTMADMEPGSTLIASSMVLLRFSNHDGFRSHLKGHTKVPSVS